MVGEGDEAPAFALPGSVAETTETFDLTETTERGRSVLLLFYPFDFSPVCTNELCAIRDAEWFRFTPDLDVWAISGDSVYAHEAFAAEFDLHFPLLSDTSGRVAESYGSCHDELEGHERVPQRAVFLVDSDRTVRYAWRTDNPYVKPDFFPVKDALDELVRERDDFEADDVDLTVEYDDGPGRTEP